MTSLFPVVCLLNSTTEIHTTNAYLSTKYSNSIKLRPTVFFSFALYSVDSQTSNSFFFRILILQLSDDPCCVQNYSFVIKGKKSSKTKPCQNLQTLEVLVLSKFDHTFTFVMLISKRKEKGGS